MYNFVAYTFITIYAWYSLLKFKWSDEKSRRSLKNQVKRRTASMSRRFAYYILAFLLTWAAGLSHRVYNLISPNPVFALLLLHTVFTPSTGILNAIAYGASYRKNIFRWLKRNVILLLRFLLRNHPDLLQSKWLRVEKPVHRDGGRRKRRWRKRFRRGNHHNSSNVSTPDSIAASFGESPSWTSTPASPAVSARSFRDI